jgi:hypothetical protein
MTVIAEVKSAVLVLIVLHLSAFAVMVGYRLHTQQYYITEATIARELQLQLQLQLLAEQEQATAEGLLAEKSKKNETIHNPLEQYEAPVQLLSKSVSDARESVASRMEAIRRHAQTLDLLEQNLLQLVNEIETGNNSDDDGDSSSEADIQSSLTNWRELLSVGSLREIPDHELSGFFENAVDEIMAIVEFNDDDDDDEGNYKYKYGNNKLAKRFLFDTGLGANIVKEPIEFVCPEPREELTMDSDDETDKEQTNDPRKKFVYESDMDIYLKKLVMRLRNRTQAKGINALFPESKKSVENEIEEQLGVVLEDIEIFVEDLENQLDLKREDDENNDTGRSSSSCIDPDMVNELVSAGLNAQMAHSDVREALRKTILQYDSRLSEEELILDADLDIIGGGGGAAASNNRANPSCRNDGAAGTCGCGNGRRPLIQNFNLRSTIDTPLLVKSVDWIDAVVDAIGGYSDELDQYLDQWTGLHGTTSVGEVMVESILEQAGKVGDINVEKYLMQK